MPWSKRAVASKKAAVATIAATQLVALLAGCTLSSQRAGADDQARVTNSVNLLGFSPEYKRGFTAGCENAKVAAVLSARRPKGDAPFVQGWQDGLDYCRSRKPG